MQLYCVKPSCTPLPRLDTLMNCGSIDVENTEYALDAKRLDPLTVYATSAVPVLNEATAGKYTSALGLWISHVRATWVHERLLPRLMPKSMMPALPPRSEVKPPHMTNAPLS